MSKDTPMMKQYLDIKKNHPNEFLFYRMGDFYEVFFEDAVKASKILNITLTRRNKKSEIPMAGIPYHASEVYISKLIRLGHSVAICEQMNEAKKGTLVKREVVRVITPSTVSEDNYIDPQDTVFLSSIYYSKDHYGISSLNMSNGEFIIYSADNLDETIEILKKIDPNEIIINKQLELFFPTSMFKSVNFLEDCFFNITNIDKIKSKGLIELNFSKDKHYKNSFISAGAVCLYIEHTQKTNLSYMKNIKTYNDLNILKLDNTTIKNLELIKNTNGESEKTLFTTLNNTNTSMGARLLKNWICNPIISKSDINERLDNVESIIDKKISDNISDFLKTFYDIERILTRVSLNSAKPRDLSNLRSFLDVAPKIIKFLKKENLFKNKINKIEDFSSLLSLLNSSIVEYPPQLLRDGDVIKKGYNEELDKLRELIDNSDEVLFDIEDREKKEIGYSKLKISYNKTIGFYIAISKKQKDKVPSHYILIQDLKNESRYTIPELKKLEEEKLTSNSKAITLEKIIFEEILVEIKNKTLSLNRYACFFSEVDVINSFSISSVNNYYNRPVFDGNSILIEKGRHPVIEHYTNDSFTDNDFDLSGKKMILLTGANMGGKSTYMRQNALILIMAHIGCFVPAKSALIKNIDRIFTRIGSGDDLSEGLSTFMVEMKEMSTIMNNATSKSFVLVDEVGRGTSINDGLSLALSFAEELSSICDTIFSTHYFELTKLEVENKNIINMYMDSIKYKDDLIFLHKIEKGSVDQSYGLEVAKMAGISSKILSSANKKLKKLRNNDNIKNKLNKNINSDLLDRITESKLSSLSKEHAIKLLSEIQKEFKSKE